jgi:hypothetical protein
LPLTGRALRSGSKVLLKETLKDFNPEKPESTIKRAAEPITITAKVTMLMILTAFWLLFERRYLLAM